MSSSAIPFQVWFLCGFFAAALPTATAALDLNGTILQCNKAMADFLGKPASEIAGGTCWELMHGTSGPIKGCPVERMKASLQGSRKSCR